MLTRLQPPRKIPVTVTMMSETTRWAAPLALTRVLLVGLCVCWSSYTSAESTQRDPSQDQTQTQDAVEAIRLAADQGLADAQFNLGFRYADGRGVSQDYAEAVRWYRLAADQGHAGAQSNLGVMYGSGEGVPQDETEAVRWYRLAADQGHAGAQFNLGVSYSSGEGLPQDDVGAHIWFNLAASQSSGDDRETYVKARDAVAARMTSEQITEAQRLAREWKPTVEP